MALEFNSGTYSKYASVLALKQADVVVKDYTLLGFQELPNMSGSHLFYRIYKFKESSNYVVCSNENNLFLL